MSKYYNQVCIRCNQRWLDGLHDDLRVSMCKPCQSTYNLKTKRHASDNEAVDLVYHRLKKREFKIVKRIEEYLR